MYPQQQLDYQPIAYKYDPYQIPPNLEMARVHAQAKQVGFVNFQKHDRKLCQCCNMPIIKDSVNLSVDVDRLKFLGTGYPLFFNSIKMYVILLIFACLTVSVYNVTQMASHCYQNYTFDLYMEDGDCIFFVGVAYTRSLSDDQLMLQALLNLIGTIVISIGMYIIKYYQNKATEKNLNTQHLPSDYTILITNVPQRYTVKDIRKFLNDNFLPLQDDTFLKITFSLDVYDYLRNSERKIELLSEQRRIFAQFTKPEDIKIREAALQQMMREIQVIDGKLSEFEKQVAVNPVLLRTGYVFVTFETEKEVSKILQRCQMTYCEKIQDNLGLDDCVSSQDWRNLDGYRAQVRRAPDPLDVKWEHLGRTRKRLRRLLSILANLSVIVVGAIVVYGISYGQNQINSSSFVANYVLSGLCVIALQIVNFILEWLVKVTSKFERHATHTHETRSIVITQIIMQFINTALIPFVLFAFTNFNQKNLVSQLFFIFLGNVLILPFLEIVDPHYIIKIFQRRKLVEQGFHSQFTQKQANQIQEGPDYRIDDKYSSVNKSLLMCAFYMTIFPYGSILQILSLMVYYWCCKYTLLSRAAQPPNLSSDLQDSVYSITTLIPLVMAAGAICYEFVIVKSNGNVIIHIFNLSLAFMTAIWLDIQKFNNAETVPKETRTYAVAKMDFKTDYDRCNPITKSKAQYEWHLDESA